MKISVTSFLIFIISLTCKVHAQQTFYATPSKSTSDLEKVRDQVRTVTRDMTSNIIVILKNGTYHLDRTLELTQADGGTNGYKVIWKAETPGKVFISGGERIKNWTLYDAKKNIWKAEVGTEKFRQLYVNGHRRIRARTPNIDGKINLGPYNWIIGVDRVNKTVSIRKDEISKWDNFNQVEMIFYPSWYHYRLRLASFDIKGDNANISFGSDTENGFKQPNNFFIQAPYFFENAYEFLDQEGEWYLNESKGEVFYKPMKGEDLSTVEIVAPQVKTLFSIKGSTAQTKARNIIFKGLTFMYSTWNYPSEHNLVLTQAFQPQPLTLKGSFDEAVRPPGAVRVDFGESINFYNNKFTQLGANGLCYFIGNTNCEVDHNTFEYISGNGLVIDEHNALAPQPENRSIGFKVTNNYFQYMGMDYTNGIAILANRVSNLIIENNTITNLPYTAIQVGNQPEQNVETATENITIAYNDISNFTNIHSDGGAIYTLGPQPGCVIRENYVHDWKRPQYESKIAASAGVYLDNFGRYIVIERNCVEGYPLNAPRTYPYFVQSTTSNYFLMDAIRDDKCIKSGAGIDHAARGCQLSCPPLANPQNLKINFNTLTWDSVSGASGYLVWMSTDQSGKYTKYVDVGNKTSLSLSAKYYAVQAYGNQRTCKSEFSEEVKSNISPLNAQFAELEDCDYIHMKPDTSSEYFNHKGLRFAGGKDQFGEIVFIYNWPTNKFHLKVAYLAAHKGSVNFELSVAGKLVDTWNSEESTSGLCIKTTLPELVKNGEEVSLKIIPIQGALGQVDYLEMIPDWE